MVIPWDGYSLGEFISWAEPLPSAKYVQFISASDNKNMPNKPGGYDWPYYEGLRMDEAMNPLCLLTFGCYGEVLPNQNGAPIRLVMLTEQTRDWEHGNRARVFAGVRRYALLATLGSVVLLPPLLVFMPDLVRLLFASKNLGAVTAARIVVVAGAVQFVVGWSKSFAVTVGRPQWRIWSHGIETVVLLPLAVVLGWKWGAAGAAGAVLVSSVAFAIVWLVLFLRIRREPAGAPPVAVPPEQAVAASELELEIEIEL